MLSEWVSLHEAKSWIVEVAFRDYRDFYKNIHQHVTQAERRIFLLSYFHFIGLLNEALLYLCLDFRVFSNIAIFRDMAVRSDH